MTNTIQFKRTTLLDKRPVASGLALGEPAVVLHQSSFGIFLKDSNGDVRKIGPTHVGANAPNTYFVGSSGVSIGEGWVDTANSNALKIWDGTGWLTVSSAGGSSFDPYIVDFGLDIGSVDYGLVTDGTIASSESWGNSLSYLTN